MRLSAVHCQGIKQVVGKTLGSSATVILFGSRLDNKARGGDDVRYGMLLSKNAFDDADFFTVSPTNP